MIKEKRKVRGYKITDTDYSKAMKRGLRDDIKLATLIEEMVIAYGKCLPFSLIIKSQNKK